MVVPQKIEQPKGEVALKLKRGDKVIGPKGLMYVVDSVVEIIAYDAKKRKQTMVHLMMTHKRPPKKDLKFEEYVDWRKEFEFFAPKAKPRRRAFLEWIAKKLFMEVKFP